MSLKLDEPAESADRKSPEKEMQIDRRDGDEDNGYLSKKINKRTSRLKNYYAMQSMEVEAEPEAKPEEQGFWARLSRMFCGGRE
jgi:hypothetical protein